MPIRTKADIVESILGNNYDGSADLVPFIRVASNIVTWIDEVCDVDNLMSASELKELEAWLAAHFYHAQDHMYSSKSTGGASGSFQGQTAMNFSATFYGQTALLMDTSGCLAKRQKEVEQGGRIKAGMTWIGTKTSEVNDRITDSQ
jgi:hypothetical protein